MPTFNSHNTIIETIESVLSQDTQSWELIIVDDGSTDDTLHLIENYYIKDSRIKIYKRERDPKGGSTCRNIGIQNASGEFVLFLDSDDLLEPFSLSQRLKAMDEYPDLEIGIFLMKRFYKRKGDSNEIVNILDSSDSLVNYLKGRFPWAITSPIWKRSLLIELKGFNEEYKRMQDPELHVRALLNKVNYKLFYNYPVDCFYRIIPSKYSTNHMIKEMTDGYIKFYDDYFKIVVQNGKKSQINALNWSLRNLLFEIARMCNDRVMLKTTIQKSVKIKMIKSSSANYLLFKYTIIQKIIFFLKKIRSFVRMLLSKYGHNANYLFNESKIL
jgi:glycosyltransferase involved in cell wall biosynthesis